MEVLTIVLPDGVKLATHNQTDEHWQRVVSEWVDRHSDEYEIVPQGEKGTGKKQPQVKVDFEDMPEAKYKELRPYSPHPTCRISALI